jgi:hypothetical protein
MRTLTHKNDSAENDRMLLTHLIIVGVMHFLKLMLCLISIQRIIEGNVFNVDLLH